VIRLVLFDIDGTLIRSGGAGVKSFERAFATQFNLPQATKGIQFAGRTDPSLVRECFTRAGIESSAENFQRFYEAYLHWLERLLPQLGGETCPGVVNLIESILQLPSPPQIGLLTGNIRPGAQLKLSHYGLWDYFPFGAFGDDNENRNELARVAQQRGSERCGRPLSGDEILVIGDTPLDIACAEAIGAKILAVATGGHSLCELEVRRPTWAVASCAGLDIAQLCGA